MILPLTKEVSVSSLVQSMAVSVAQLVEQWLPTSVTRLGDLLDFGQLFKAFGKN